MVSSLGASWAKNADFFLSRRIPFPVLGRSKQPCMQDGRKMEKRKNKQGVGFRWDADPVRPISLRGSPAVPMAVGNERTQRLNHVCRYVHDLEPLFPNLVPSQPLGLPRLRGIWWLAGQKPPSDIKLIIRAYYMYVPCRNGTLSASLAFFFDPRPRPSASLQMRAALLPYEREQNRAE